MQVPQVFIYEYICYQHSTSGSSGWNYSSAWNMLLNKIKYNWSILQMFAFYLRFIAHSVCQNTCVVSFGLTCPHKCDLFTVTFYPGKLQVTSIRTDTRESLHKCRNHTRFGQVILSVREKERISTRESVVPRDYIAGINLSLYYSARNSFCNVFSRYVQSTRRISGWLRELRDIKFGSKVHVGSCCPTTCVTGLNTADKKVANLSLSCTCITSWIASRWWGLDRTFSNFLLLSRTPFSITESILRTYRESSCGPSSYI